FFFQAEDGIRGRNVTGVQTCALPISFPAMLIALVRIADDQGLARFPLEGVDEAEDHRDEHRGKGQGRYEPADDGTAEEDGEEQEIGRASCRERGGDRGAQRSAK